MSNVLQPTHYGPVSYKTQAGSTAINDQTQGTITKLVKQPCNDSYPTVDNNGNWRYVEIWKGPTSVVKNLPKTAFIIGKSLSQARALAGNIFVERFDAPSLPNGLTWVVFGVTVKQNTAGDTSELRVTFNGQKLNSSGSWTEDKKENVWSLQWQPYSVTPYAFCANPGKEDRTESEQPDDRDEADRYNIETFLRETKGRLSSYTYYAQDGVVRKLNSAEQLISKKIISNTNCQWHYPVLTHKTNKSTALSIDVQTDTPYPEEIGGVDYKITTTPEGCPYEFDKDYEWVKIDDSVECQKDYAKLKYIRTESWMGVISADNNYYGNGTFDHRNLDSCRWEIGKL